MKNTLVRRIGSAVAALMIGLLPVASAYAVSTWGPDRPALHYVKNQPGTDQVNFNSFVDTDVYGNERTFFDGKTDGFTTDGGYQDSINVNGKTEALLRIYVHNNADPSKNGADLKGPGVATNTQVRVALPTTTGRSAVANAFISADNNTPSKTIFDSLDFVTSGAQGFSLSYEPGTARIYNNATGLAGRALDDSIVTTGAAIGYDKNDGIVPGCFQYANYITLKVKINPAKITFDKTVGVPGSGKLQKELTGQVAGNTVSWVLNYKNDTGAQVNNLIVRDQLPAHVKVVPGSVMQFDGNFPNGYQRTDTGLFTSGGVNLGAYAAGASGYIRFKTTISDDLVCGANAMTNNAWIKADGVTEVQSWARVTATKTCTTPELPHTGAEGLATGVLGTSAIGYSINAYLRSKRGLLEALRNVTKR